MQFGKSMMDKSRINIRDRTSKAYIDGVEQFLDFAYSKKAHDATIYCSCKKCGNRYFVIKISNVIGFTLFSLFVFMLSETTTASKEGRT